MGLILVSPYFGKIPQKVCGLELPTRPTLGGTFLSSGPLATLFRFLLLMISFQHVWLERLGASISTQNIFTTELHEGCILQGPQTEGPLDLR